MTVTRPAGFLAAGVTAGLKPSRRPDVALVVNQGPDAHAAAVFTGNRCVAHPVTWSRQAIADGQARAVVLNSGGANCFTGPEGFQTTHGTAELAGKLLGVDAVDVIVCSTGVIGQQLPREPLYAGVTAAVAALSDVGGEAAARAIMTTDTVHKQAAVTAAAGWSVGGMAKGAGMLAPALATMLAVLTTDAVVPADQLDAVLRDVTSRTFDRVDVDGCMSTNDTVLLMASGASGHTPEKDQFARAVYEVCDDLCRQLVADAEGVEHEISIEVRGAASEHDALCAGRAVARSNLFKCAIAGNDPNWGRVIAALGTTEAAFDPDTIDVDFNGVRVCQSSGIGAPVDTVDLTGRQIHVRIDLHAGAARATVRTTDLTHGYVTENSAYTT
jgi:glutamate N-acetyltransferase/amino-acid N-acetyltransferase